MFLAASSFLTLALTVSATPSIFEGIAKRKTPTCSLYGATFTVPANQTAVVPPSNESPSFLALAAGVQNYTCTAATSTYTNVGAVAQLIDGSCVYHTKNWNSAPDELYNKWLAAPASESDASFLAYTAPGLFHVPTPVLGQHYFVATPGTSGPTPSSPATNISPRWDFTDPGDAFPGNAEAFVIGARAGSVNAPDAARDVAWLFLTSVEGELADEIFRIQTRGGQPPASCTPGSPDISVRYVSQYWFYGGSIA